MKQLIVNADDYGLSTAINQGIVEAHHHGIVTSTTIMANGSALDDGLTRLRDAPDLDTGCHLVLVDGMPCASPSMVSSLLDQNGQFPRTLSSFLGNVAAGRARHHELVIELRAQFERLISLGIKLSHCDTHKHTHAHPRILDAVIEVLEEYKIPFLRMPFEEFPWLHCRALPKTAAESMTFWKRRTLASMMNRIYRPYYQRRMRKTQVRSPDFFHGFVITGRLRPDNLAALLACARDGVNEFLCHPAIGDSTQTIYETRRKMARVGELQALCSEEVKWAIDNHHIELTNFRKVIDMEPTTKASS